MPQPEEFEDVSLETLSVRQQVNRSNLPLETKSAILTALEKPTPRDKKSHIFQAVEARVSDARKLTNTSLADLEKVVQDALRAKTSKIAYQKVYRENGKLWKVVPKTIMEPDHAMRLRVVELFMKPPAIQTKSKKTLKVTDPTGTVSRLRGREESLEGSVLDGNGNGDRE